MTNVIQTMDGKAVVVIGWQEPEGCKTCGHALGETFLIRVDGQEHRFTLQRAFELAQALRGAAYQTNKEEKKANG